MKNKYQFSGSNHINRCCAVTASAYSTKSRQFMFSVKQGEGSRLCRGSLFISPSITVNLKQLYVVEKVVGDMVFARMNGRKRDWNGIREISAGDTIMVTGEIKMEAV